MNTRARRFASTLFVLAGTAGLASCGDRNEATPRTVAPAASKPPATPAPAPAPPTSPTSVDAFFEAVERGDDTSALAALPADARNASPYDAKTAALPVATRDLELYARLAARMDEAKPVPPASRAEAAVPFAVGCIAYRAGDLEAARRAFHLALTRDPLHRMAHLYLARVYGALETEALRTPEAKSAGAILAEKIGVGSSDTHVEMAQEIVDKAFPEKVAAVGVSFLFDQGAVRDVKLEATTASANSRMQRPAAALPPAGSFRVTLVGADHEVLDERWFAPVERLYVDGPGPAGMLEGGHSDKTTFSAAVELLAPRTGQSVLFFDAAGKRIAQATMP